MPVEHVQCPDCGAPLSAEAAENCGAYDRTADFPRSERLATCGYCGARLRITKGASGYPMATLDDIKVDTSLLAREVACRRLEEKQKKLAAERADLLRRHHIESALAQATCDRRVKREAVRMAASDARARMAMVAGALAALVTGAALCWQLPRAGWPALLATSMLFGLALFLLTGAIAWRLSLRQQQRRHIEEIRSKRQAEHKELDQEAEKALHELDRQIRAAKQHLDRIRSDIDRLTAEL